MPRKSLGPFSGRQLTLIAVTLILAIAVPGSVFAIDTFSNVAIEDPASGVKASVDGQHRLKTNDSITGTLATTQTAPPNLVRIFANASTGCQTVYTIPAGKALVLKSATGVVGTNGGNIGELDLFAGTTCTAANVVTSFDTDRLADTIGEPLGAGVGIPAGSALSIEAPVGDGTLEAYGYLVPASAIPSAGAAASGRPFHGLVPRG
jgi:hypothetical protein